ncbi:uncharacterized protein LOC132166756 isoform X2 [Corylus avellana]|uniref:uncharacterized protein LOC132166756 isoform X2 n=1 Tax=Corylus avellana TaxID=13451 RepID=UPI00286C5590|nr:uncharacterized protein LOC132166756 isoform X2 [Corylus avellana]
MAKSFSRNVKLENVYDRPMKVEVRRDPDVLVYLEGSREMGETHILPADIRANEKLELNYLNHAITITPTRGHFISRLGFIIRLKRVAQCYGRGSSRLLEGVGNNAAKEEDLKGKVDLEEP